MENHVDSEILGLTKNLLDAGRPLEVFEPGWIRVNNLTQ